jgi:transposase-like protein
MAENAIEERAVTKAEQWRDRMAAFKQSGMSVRQFCKENGIAEHSFYGWRKRLQQSGPVRFALVDRGGATEEQMCEATLELVFRSGERLRIGNGVDASALRTVLEALRG